MTASRYAPGYDSHAIRRARARGSSASIGRLLRNFSNPKFPTRFRSYLPAQVHIVAEEWTQDRRLRIMPTSSGYGAYGSLRMIVAGPGYCLPEALANVERVAGVDEVTHHRPRNLAGRRIALRSEEGSGHCDVVHIGNDVIVASGSPAHFGKYVEPECGDALVQFHIELPAELEFEKAGGLLRRGRPGRLGPADLLEAGLQTRLGSHPRDRFVAISVRTRYLTEHFLSAAVRGPDELRAVLDPEPDTVRYGDTPLSAGMLECIARLIDNPYSGTLALIHTEAATLEVLCAVAVEFGGLMERLGERYNTLQLRRLQTARELLLTQRSPVPTIREVARTAGMNETALKRGFRTVFGETLFDFSVRHRMRQALGLLRDGSMPVSRVADAVGYRHQASFASAFRRYFGVSPKEARSTKSTSVPQRCSAG